MVAEHWPFNQFDPPASKIVFSGVAQFSYAYREREMNADEDGVVAEEMWAEFMSALTMAIRKDEAEIEVELARARRSGPAAGTTPSSEARRSDVDEKSKYKTLLFPHIQPPTAARFKHSNCKIGFKQWRVDAITWISSAWPQLKGPCEDIATLERWDRDTYRTLLITHFGINEGFARTQLGALHHAWDDRRRRRKGIGGDY